MGAACGADGVPGEVGVDAVEVDCCGAEDVGQGCFGLASVTAAADASGADGLGDGALDAGALVEALFPGVGFLRDALLLEEFVFLAGVQGKAPGETAGARGADLAVAAVPFGEDDHGPRLSVHAGVAPVSALGPLGADRVLLVPVDLEVGEREAFVGPGLAVTCGRQGPEEVDALGACGQDDRGGGVAAVDQVLARFRPRVVPGVRGRLRPGGSRPPRRAWWPRSRSGGEDRYRRSRCSGPCSREAVGSVLHRESPALHVVFRRPVGVRALSVRSC